MLTTAQVILIYTFTLGSLYLLISLGFSVICGVLRIFHMGYAYIFVVAIYVTWMFMQALGLGLIPSICAMVAVQAGIALAVYKGVIKRWPLEEEKMVVGFLLIALVIEQAALHWYPEHVGVYLETTLVPGAMHIGPTYISNQLLFGAVIGLALTGLFILFFTKSRMGLAARAISQDLFTSRLMGINVERIYILVMIISVIPVIVAMLIVAPVWVVKPGMGWDYMITAILVCVLGGLGNLRGTLMASYLIGFTHSITCFALGLPRFMGLSGLVLVLIILIVRSEGLTRTEALW